jgi:hypothetical protein
MAISWSTTTMSFQEQERKLEHVVSLAAQIWA